MTVRRTALVLALAALTFAAAYLAAPSSSKPAAPPSGVQKLSLPKAAVALPSAAAGTLPALARAPRPPRRRATAPPPGPVAPAPGPAQAPPPVAPPPSSGGGGGGGGGGIIEG